MSQFIVFNPTGPSGGGPVLTLTGNNPVAIGPTGGNINIVGDTATGITVTGVAIGSTLTITNAGGKVDTVTTVGAVTATLATITLAVNEVVLINSQVIGAYEAAIDAGIGGDFSVLARKQGAAAATIIQNPVPIMAIKTQGEASTIGIVSVGNDVLVRVTGRAGATIDWKSVTTIVRQVAP